MAVMNEPTEPEHAADVAVIDVRGLRMWYGGLEVLDGVAFTAARGEVLALLGPNGAGKTTTIEILEGFRLRSAGEVRVLGVDPATAGEHWRARAGIVLQSWRDHGKWRVRELLTHLGKYYRPYSTAQRPRPRNVDELIETLGSLIAQQRRLRASPAGNAAASMWRSGSSGVQSCCFSMSPPPGSTRWCDAPSTTWCTGSPIWRTPRS